MGAVDLDRVEIEPQGALGGPDEGLLDPLQAVPVERRRLVPARPVRLSGGPDRVPAALGDRRYRLAAVPRQAGGSLAPGVGELDAELGAAGVATEADHPRQRRLVLVGIEPDAARRDAADRLHPGGLDHDQAGAGDRELAQVHDVPVPDRALAGGVLAHRRQHDAVGKLHPAQGDGRKQFAGHDSPHICCVYSDRGGSFWHRRRRQGHRSEVRNSR